MEEKANDADKGEGGSTGSVFIDWMEEKANDADKGAGGSTGSVLIDWMEEKANDAGKGAGVAVISGSTSVTGSTFSERIVDRDN